MPERSCACRDWLKLANYAFFPIWFDSKISEYIMYGQKANQDIVIYYCLRCGGRMPKPPRIKFFELGRGKFLTTPSEDEMAQARSLLEGVIDAGTMRSALGEPDQVFDGYSDESGELISNRDGPNFKRQYTYTSRWQTLRLAIRETLDGQLRFFFQGQPKDSNEA